MKRALTILPAIFAACVIMLASSSQPARASAGDTFTIYNEGSHTIYEVYAEPVDYGDWGPELLGSGYMLSPGHSFQPLAWHYGADPYVPSCMHDVRVIYSDAHVEYKYGIDICNYNLTFYY